MDSRGDRRGKRRYRVTHRLPAYQEGHDRYRAVHRRRHAYDCRCGSNRGAPLVDSPQKYAECNHCTYKLVVIAYRRAPWFRLLREPMILGIRTFAWLHRVDVGQYVMRTEACNNCIRFYKAALFRKSRAFRWIHNRTN